MIFRIVCVSLLWNERWEIVFMIVMVNFGMIKILMGLRRRFGLDIKISNKNNNKK